MSYYSNSFATVYTFENPTANRVKVGVTGIGLNDTEGRLKDVNDKWLSKKATCQIYGSRRKLTREGLIPKHVTNGHTCSGCMRLPFERDAKLAYSHLNVLKVQVLSLTGSSRSSVTRQINSLSKRLQIFSNYQQPRGLWYINTIYHTRRADLVEELAHEKLSELIDQSAPFGEIFCCSVVHARSVVETVIECMSLLDNSKRIEGTAYTSSDYGQCPICNNNLTKSGVCPDCSQRLLDSS